jgi:hypothetical protein
VLENRQRRPGPNGLDGAAGIGHYAGAVDAAEDTVAHRWKDIAIAIAAAAPLAIAVVRTAAAPTVQAVAHASPETAAHVASDVARAEPMMRRNARRNFPGDHWSQDDDFHNQERVLAGALASRYGLDPSEVFAIIDADLRRQRDPHRESGAAPCKPRPFYD